MATVSFDRFDRPYQQHARQHLMHTLKYGARLTTIAGDTRFTVPRFSRTHPRLRCDLVHPSAREHDDFLNLHAMAWRSGPPSVVIPTAHDRDGIVYGVAWRDAVRDQLIYESGCEPAMHARKLNTKFIFNAKAGRAATSHIFCWGEYSQKPPLHSGAVIQELGDRILARSIASSVVMFIGRRQAQSALRARAMAEGHRVVSTSQVENIRAKVNGVAWVLLLFVDAGGDESSVLQAPAMRKLLTKATVTYIVVRFSSKVVRILQSMGYKVRCELGCMPQICAWHVATPHSIQLTPHSTQLAACHHLPAIACHR